jgi:uncharacterized YccA/Bax inhibitor family protein
MQSKNPVFNRDAVYAHEGAAPVTPSADELQRLYDAPPASAAQAGRMSIDDVVVRTGTVFAVLLVAAAIGWQLVDTRGVLLGALVVGLVLGLVNSFRRRVSPALVLAYAAAEGVFIGGLSAVYDSAFGGGVVRNAVLGTLCAFAAMLVAYRSGRLRATPKFMRVVMIAGLAYAGVALVSLVSAVFGAGDGWGLYGMGGLGVLLCLAGVAIASLFLVLDFDFIDRGIRNGAPAREAWRAAFGLTVTLVWLYLELLRLFAVLGGRD